MSNEPSPYFIRRTGRQPGDLVGSDGFVPADGGLFSFQEGWRVLREYRWLILAVMLASLAAALLYVTTRVPIFTAEATVMIDRQPPRVLKAQEDTQTPPVDYYGSVEYYKTQYEVLRSRDLASLALRNSGIGAELAAKTLRQQSGTLNYFGGLPTAKHAAASATAVQPSELSLIPSYLSMLSVAPVQGTSLVRIGFNSPDPELSARLANTHASAYMRYGIEMRSRANKDAIEFLQKKLLDLKERLEKSEAALNSYRKEKGIISLDDKGNLTIDRLNDLNNRLTEAEADRISQEAHYQVARSGNYDALPSIASSTAVQGLKTELAKLQSEYSQLAKEFKAGYPRLDKVKAQIDTVQKQLTSELQSEARRVEGFYRAASKKESELRARVEAQKKLTLDLKDAGVQYAILAREVDTNRQLYESVLQRLKEMSVAAEVRSSNVYLMEQAQVPGGPSYPRKPRTLLMGLLLGLAGGIGLAFLLDRLDNTLKTPAESEQYLRLPNLAVIPDFATVDGARAGYLPYHLRRVLNQPTKATAESGNRELILAHHPLSIIAESYRSLRTALLLSRAAERPRTLLITSATRHEGKTATSVNTAIMFAQMGLKTILVDGDLRRPRCHKVLTIEKAAGLTEVLTGLCPLDDAIGATASENFFFLSSGSLPPNPAELLGSEKMKSLIDTLADKFDCVIFDSPPVMPVTDAILIARNVDGVVLVVDSQSTAKQLIREVRSKLVNYHAKILGIVLNRVDTQSGGYSRYYSHYTNYYHEERAQDTA